MIMDGEQTDEDDSDGAGTLGHDDVIVEEECCGVNEAADETGQGIDVATEDEWDLVDEDVTDDTTCCSGEHAHDIGGPEGEAGIVGLLEADDGEEGQADGIKEEDSVGDAVDEPMEEDEEQQRETIDGEVDPLRHPERALSQHEVTEGTSPDGSDHADDEGAEEIELLGRGQAKAGDGEGEGSQIIYDVDKIHTE